MSKKVTDLTELNAPQDDDLFLIYEDSSSTSKKITRKTLNEATETLKNKTIESPLGIVKGDVGLGNVDNTSDATKNSASATLTNKTLTSPKIDHIVEETTAHGVDIDGLLIKDSKLATNDSVVTTNITDANVTMPKISNPYKFSAYRNAALTIASGNYLVFDAELFDTNNNFDITTGIYTAPVSGYYMFDACVAFGINANPNVAYALVLYKNAAAYALQNYVNMYAGGYTIEVAGSKLLQVTAGDTLRILVYCLGGGSAITTGAGYTYFDGFLVSTT